MAGISAYYYVGEAGGYLGSDGLNGRDIEITIWEADKRTLVVNYLNDYYVPMSPSLKSFVPNGPDDDMQAKRALILFASNLFKDCPSYQKVKIECEGIDSIDFSSGYNVPRHFDDLLEESKQLDLSDKVHMYLAILSDVKI